MRDAPGPKASGPSGIYTDFFLLQLAALVFLCDQFTKFLVRAFLPFRDSFPVEGFFRLTHTHNTGSAFGLFQGHNFPLILVAIFGIGVLVLVYYSQRQRTNLLRVSIALQIGGAFGNLIDRIRLGHVTDFLDVGPWPVFNIADSSIVVGLVILGWIFLGPGSRSARDASTVDSRPRSSRGQAFRGNDELSEASLPDGPSIGTTAGITACPVCGGRLDTVPDGRRCAACGVALLLQTTDDGDGFPLAGSP